jgi:ATP-dependent Clp protease ATP-binding subunit ClpA
MNFPLLFYVPRLANFTTAARQVISSALQTAQNAGSDFIEADHIASALCDKERLLVERLSGTSNYELLRSETAQLRHLPASAHLRDLAFSRDAARCLKRSEKMADVRHGGLVSPVHILASLTMSRTNVAEILGRYGITETSVAREIPSGDAP